MSTLLVIAPGKHEVRGDCCYTLLVAETGEPLASHICSDSGFAYGDLYGNRPERQEEWQERFGEIDVKYINETEISEDQLIERNHAWFDSLEVDYK